MKSLISHRLYMDGINEICLLVQGEQNHSLFAWAAFGLAPSDEEIFTL